MVVLNDSAEITKDYFGDIEYQPTDIYDIEVKTGMSSHDITLYYNQTSRRWTGTIIEYGEWRHLDDDEIEQVKEFLKEKGYL